MSVFSAGKEFMESRQNKMAEMPMKPLLFTMAVPLMMSLLVQSLYNIVDSIFVAVYSETALTATTLVYSVQFLMIAIGVGTAVGLNALLSRKVGQNLINEACRAATSGFILMTITSALFCIVGLTSSGTIAGFLTEDTQLQLQCRQYLSVNLVWCFGLFYQTYAQRLLQAVGDTKLSMYSLIIGAVTNIVLDPIMIFGYFGCPEMGIKGAAIATVIAQIISAIAAFLFNKYRNPYIHIRWKGYRWNWRDVVEIYRVGLPTMIMQAIGAVMNLAINGILIQISSTAVATFGVYYKLQNFLLMPMNGLGQAAIPIVGFNYGAGNANRIKELWKILIPVGIIFSITATVIFLLIPGQLLSLFSAGKEMLGIGVPALRIISVTFIFSTFTILCGYFGAGLGNGIINMVGTALRQLIILIPILHLFVEKLGLPWAWCAFWISEAVAFLYSITSIKTVISKTVKQF